MRVLITGSTGMLGRTLAPYLEEKGHTVIRHGHSNIVDIVCDLTDRLATESMLKSTLPDCVVNLVAATNVDECERDPHKAYLLNVLSVENLVSELGKRKKTFLVQISTDQLYDSQGENGEDNVCLKNTYALSKYAGELAALRMQASVLRTNFFGPSKHPIRKSFSDWVIDNFRAEKAFTGFTDVNVSPILMNTLSKVIDMVICQKTSGIFNVGSRNGMSKAEFAEAIAYTFGLSSSCMRKGRAIDVALEARRPNGMSMSCSKFERTFGILLPNLIDEIKLLRSLSNGGI